jgi:hypothetical protein
VTGTKDLGQELADLVIQRSGRLREVIAGRKQEDYKIKPSPGRDEEEEAS